MPFIKFNYEKIWVENEKNTNLEDISAIPQSDLFINYSSEVEGTFAFSIEEIEDYMLSQKNLYNFHTKPRRFFSPEDLIELSNRSNKIYDFLQTYIDQTKALSNYISFITLEKMQFFAEHSADSREDAILNGIYSEEEIQQFAALVGEASVSRFDLIRGIVFAKFKEYYSTLSDQEKNSIDQFPGVSDFLSGFGIQSGKFVDIFNLPGDACLGGTAGVCKYISDSIALMKNYNESLLNSNKYITYNHRADILSKLKEYIDLREGVIELGGKKKKWPKPKLFQDVNLSIAKIRAVKAAYHKISRTFDVDTIKQVILDLSALDKKQEQDAGISRLVTKSEVQKTLDAIDKSWSMKDSYRVEPFRRS